VRLAGLKHGQGGLAGRTGGRVSQEQDRRQDDR
jgi:hypothetical protein